jgi:hypothetical protein
MITIKLNYYKLREAAFKYEQTLLKEIQAEQNKLVDKYLTGFFLFRKPSRFEAMKRMDKEYRGQWQLLNHWGKEATEEYRKIRTACNLAEDGLVEIDADTVYKIFGDTQ